MAFAETARGSLGAAHRPPATRPPRSASRPPGRLAADRLTARPPCLAAGRLMLDAKCWETSCCLSAAHRPPLGAVKLLALQDFKKHVEETNLTKFRAFLVRIAWPRDGMATRI